MRGDSVVIMKRLSTAPIAIELCAVRKNDERLPAEWEVQALWKIIQTQLI